jgi:hypothetical protein
MDELNTTFEYVTHAAKALIAKAKELFGEGFSNLWLMRNRELWEKEMVVAPGETHTPNLLIPVIDIPSDTKGFSPVSKIVNKPPKPVKVSKNAHQGNIMDAIATCKELVFDENSADFYFGTP